MTGNVYKSEAYAGRKFEVREAEINGNTATLFFLQTVRIDARQGPHQGRLSVVDVAGGAGDDIAHSDALETLAQNPKRASSLAPSGASPKFPLSFPAALRGLCALKELAQNPKRASS